MRRRRSTGQWPRGAGDALPYRARHPPSPASTQATCVPAPLSRARWSIGVKRRRPRTFKPASHMAPTSGWAQRARSTRGPQHRSVVGFRPACNPAAWSSNGRQGGTPPPKFRSLRPGRTPTVARRSSRPRHTPPLTAQHRHRHRHLPHRVLAGRWPLAAHHRDPVPHRWPRARPLTAGFRSGGRPGPARGGGGETRPTSRLCGSEEHQRVSALIAPESADRHVAWLCPHQDPVASWSIGPTPAWTHAGPTPSVSRAPAMRTDVRRTGVNASLPTKT
jgi:hypothetical protein